MVKTSIQFENELKAQTALISAGLSIGELQRDDPRGVMFGDFIIMKWRNLSRAEKYELHGVYQRQTRGGPVTVTFQAGCPQEALTALEAAKAVA